MSKVSSEWTILMHEMGGGIYIAQNRDGLAFKSEFSKYLSQTGSRNSLQIFQSNWTQNICFIFSLIESLKPTEFVASYLFDEWFCQTSFANPQASFFLLQHVITKGHLLSNKMSNITSNGEKVSLLIFFPNQKGKVSRRLLILSTLWLHCCWPASVSIFFFTR